MDGLPIEVFKLILGHLNESELRMVREVDSTWNQMAVETSKKRDANLVRLMFEERGQARVAKFKSVMRQGANDLFEKFHLEVHLAIDFKSLSSFLHEFGTCMRSLKLEVSVDSITWPQVLELLTFAPNLKQLDLRLHIIPAADVLIDNPVHFRELIKLKIHFGPTDLGYVPNMVFLRQFPQLQYLKRYVTLERHEDVTKFRQEMEQYRHIEPRVVIALIITIQMRDEFGQSVVAGLQSLPRNVGLVRLMMHHRGNPSQLQAHARFTSEILFHLRSLLTKFQLRKLFPEDEPGVSCRLDVPALPNIKYFEFYKQDTNTFQSNFFNTDTTITPIEFEGPGHVVTLFQVHHFVKELRCFNIGTSTFQPPFPNLTRLWIDDCTSVEALTEIFYTCRNLEFFKIAFRRGSFRVDDGRYDHALSGMGEYGLRFGGVNQRPCLFHLANLTEFQIDYPLTDPVIAVTLLRMKTMKILRFNQRLVSLACLDKLKSQMTCSNFL